VLREKLGGTAWGLLGLCIGIAGQDQKGTVFRRQSAGVAEPFPYVLVGDRLMKPTGWTSDKTELENWISHSGSRRAMVALCGPHAAGSKQT
jgi:hypothetical protein